MAEKPQTWLIYGGKGWIGSQFIHYVNQLYPNVNVVYGTSRCDDFYGVFDEINNCPELERVICMIGRTTDPRTTDSTTDSTTIDYLEQPGKLVDNIRDNLYSPLNLYDVCNSLGLHLTYLGTGCIYYTPREESREYTPEDDPNFFGSSYSIVKGFTDRYFNKSFAKLTTLNVRIRMPISDDLHPKSLITKLLKYHKICDCGPNSMTIFSDLLPVLAKAVMEGKTGTMQLVNPGALTHDKILNIYQEIVDPKFHYNLMPEEEQNRILRAKRSTCVLKPIYITEPETPVPDTETSLRRIFTRLAESNQSEDK